MTLQFQAIWGDLKPGRGWTPVFLPELKDEVFKYVEQCDLCQRAKPAQNMKVGLHSATPASYPLERVFIDFMGPLVRTKKGNQAILVVMDSF